MDVINYREGTNIDMFVFWQIIYMTSLFLTTILLPFAYFFYETNEDNDYKTRFCTAFGNEIILLVIFSLINFPMFTSLRHAFIPIDSEAYKGLQQMTATAAAGSKEATLIDAIFLKPSDQSTTFNDDYTYFSI